MGIAFQYDGVILFVLMLTFLDSICRHTRCVQPIPGRHEGIQVPSVSQAVSDFLYT